MSAPDEDFTMKKEFFKNLELNDTRHRFILMRKDIQSKVSSGCVFLDNGRFGRQDWNQGKVLFR